jgi:hypothetical protein
MNFTDSKQQGALGLGRVAIRRMITQLEDLAGWSDDIGLFLEEKGFFSFSLEDPLELRRMEGELKEIEVVER